MKNTSRRTVLISSAAGVVGLVSALGIALAVRGTEVPWAGSDVSTFTRVPGGPAGTPEAGKVEVVQKLGFDFNLPSALPQGTQITSFMLPSDVEERPVAGRWVDIFIKNEARGLILSVRPGPIRGIEGLELVQGTRPDVEIRKNGDGSYYLANSPDGREYTVNVGPPDESRFTEDEIVRLIESLIS